MSHPSAGRARSLLMIGLVVLLAATGVAASLIVRGAAADRVDAAFARADGADLVLYVDRQATGELRDALKDDARVVRVGAPVASIDAELADRDRTEIEVRASQPVGTFNAPVITAGRAPADSSDVLFDAALADARGIRVGDSVTVATADGAHAMNVVGLGYDFSDCLYPTCDPAHAWVADTTLAEMAGGREVAIVALDLDDNSAAASVVAEARAQLGDDLLGSNDWPDTRGDLLVETQFFGAFLGAFGLFVLICATVVIAGAITARTVARRRVIALYKTVGFTNAQITRSILLEHVLVAIGASLGGWVAATMLGPVLRVGPLRLLEAGTADWDVRALAVTTTVTVLIVFVTTVIPAWRAGGVDVTTALTGAGNRRRRRSAPFGAVAAGVPLPATLALSALVARPLRTALNVLAVVIAVVAAIVSISIVRSVDRVVLDPALTGDPADVVVHPSDQLDPSDAARLLDRDSAVDAWFTAVDATATIDGSDVHIRAVGGDPANTGFIAGAGRMPAAAGEAAAGYGLLRQRGWQIGDRVAVTVSGSTFDVALVGWYRESEDGGEMLQIRMEDVARVSGDVHPAFGVIAASSTTTDSLVASLSEAFGATASVRPNEPDTSGVQPFRIALAVMTMLIGAIALAHVAGSMLTTQRESRRAQAIERAVGVDSSQQLAQGALHGGIVAALALIIGLPLGWYAQRAIGDLLTSEIGIGPGLTFGPSTTGLALIATTTVLTGALTTAAAIWPSVRRPPDLALAAD